MNPLWLSFQLCLALMVPSSPTEPPLEGVEVKALALEIPAIPANMQEAHAKYKALRPLMEAQLQDLEGDLKRLYAQPDAVSFFAGRLQVEKSRKEECQFLLYMLHDTKSEAMEQQILKTWEDWQTLMVENGLAQYQDRSTSIKVDPKSSQSAQNRMAGMQSMLSGERSPDLQYAPELNDKEKQIHREYRDLGPNATILNGGPDEPLNAKGGTGFDDPETQILGMVNTEFKTLPMGIVVPIINWDGVMKDKASLDRMQTAVARAIIGTRVANREMPSLALQWAPLAEHLNHCAKQLMEYERQAPLDESPTFKLLRLRAKIAFLERFRSALWFDSLAWATITTSSPPKPLASIRSEVGLGADIMREGLGNGSTTRLLPEVERVFIPADYWFPSLLPLRTNLKPLPEERAFEKRPWPGVDAFIQARILPQSNPDLVAAFRRLARDAREFETVLRIFWREHPKVRLDLQYIPVSSRVSRMKEIESSGSLLIKPIQHGFNLVVLVQQGLVDRGMDQVEPWLGQAVFTALIASRKGGVEAYEKGLIFDADTMEQSWEFQRHLRLVLKRDHPEDYEVMLLEAQERFRKGAW